MLFAAHDGDGDQAIGELERGLDGFFEAVGDAVLQQQAIDNDFDRVVLAAIERNGLVKALELAIHTRAHEPGLREFLEFLFVFALAPAHDRRENHHAIVGLERQDGLHDLLGGLARDGLPALGAMRRADGAPDDAEIIVNLGDGADGRAWRARSGLLLDGDRGREALDRVHVRPLHLIEELPRVGRKRLDVAPLALRIKRVEGKRRLAGTGKPGNDRQCIPRDFERNVLQVMLPRAADDDVLEAHGKSRHIQRGGLHSGQNSPSVIFQDIRPAKRGSIGVISRRWVSL